MEHRKIDLSLKKNKNKKSSLNQVKLACSLF